MEHNMTGLFNHSYTFRKAFECNCIKLLVSAYHKVIMENSINLNWEENDITAQLYEYMDNDQFRLNNNIWANVEFHLKDNLSPKERGYAAKYSRIDMAFSIIKSGS